METDDLVQGCIAVDADGSIVGSSASAGPASSSLLQQNFPGAADYITVSHDDFKRMWMKNERFSWRNGEFKERDAIAATADKTSIRANGQEVVTIAPLPMPRTTAVIRGPRNQTVQVTDGSLEFTTLQPGTYTIQLRAPHYLSQEFTINAS